MIALPQLSRRLFLCGLAATLPAAGRPADIGLSEILRRNARARGGLERLAALRTLETEVRITEPSFTALGRYLATADGLVRVDVYMGGNRVFSEGVDTGGVWGWSQGDAAPSAASEAGKAALLHGIAFNMLPLALMPPHAITLARKGEHDQPGLRCVELKFADGFEARLFVSPVTWQVLSKQDRRAFHPDVSMKVQRIETRYSRFKATQGVISAMRTDDVDLDTGTTIGTVETLAMQWNADISGRIPRSAPAAGAPFNR